MVIDNTYFEFEEAKIPNNKNISAQPTGSPTVVNMLDEFIDTYERQLLLDTLGVVLYSELKAEFPTPSTTKWIKLIDGNTYEIDGVTKIWDGLRGYNKQSLIAFFVFCQYLRNDEFSYTTTGVIKNVVSNAIIGDSLSKYVKSWSLFLEAYQGDSEVRVSLCSYLNDMNELDDTAFPDIPFKKYNAVNRFGI